LTTTLDKRINKLKSGLPRVVDLLFSCSGEGCKVVGRRGCRRKSLKLYVSNCTNCWDMRGSKHHSFI